MPWRNRILIVATISVLTVLLLLIVACGGPILWWQRQRGVDEDKFIATVRETEPRVARVYELFPDANASFNEGNRSGNRSAFAPIAETYTLTAKNGNGGQLILYCGIAPRTAGGGGIAVVDRAYRVQSPNGTVADVTEQEFDTVLDAKGDLGVLKPEIWTRPPLQPRYL